MRYLRAVLETGPETTHPMHAFVADHGDLTDYRLLQWTPTGADETSLLFHVRGDREAYEAALVERAEPVAYAVAPDVASSFYVYVRDRLSEPARRLAGAFAGSGLVVVPPVEYRDDRTVALGVVGPGDALQAAVAAVPDEVGVDVRRVGRYDAAALSPTGRLTDRQYEAVRVAVEAGYYETPRTATVADVAAELGCAPGTAAEHLRKAVSRVLERAVVGGGEREIYSRRSDNGGA